MDIKREGTMSKQSSIEWLISCITEDQMVKAKSLNEWLEIFDQAKAMHRKEIEFSYNCGWADGHDEATSESPLFTTGEEYYNETFGGEDE
jgi:hypothetical protein